MPTTWNAIYLGHATTFMDPYEGDSHAENATAFVGNTYGGADDPLAGHIVEISAQNTGGQRGVLDSNNARVSDKITYDLGGGAQTQVFDTVVTYNAVLTYTDGSQVNLVSGVMQDDSGNLFLIPSTSANSSVTQAFEANAIQSIELKSVNFDKYSGLYESRYDTGFVCFAQGCLIGTPDGARPVEDLAAGDLVDTLDHGAQSILWVGGRRVPAQGPGRAYRVATGALGGGYPQRELVLSAQHRVMLRSPIAARMFGKAEVLVPVNKLDGMPGIFQNHTTEIGYHHILCARHEIVQANGSWCETLLPGDQAARLLGPSALDAVAKVLPGWADMAPARPIVDGARARRLVDRHLKNGRDLVMRRPPWPVVSAPISDAPLRTVRA